MPAFALTPVAGFPPPTPAEFPNFVQFQNEGANLGGSDADTVDFVGAGVTATRGTGANANKVTVTIPGGGGGGAAPVLVVSLVGAVNGAIGDGDSTVVYFDNWNGMVVQASTEAAWDEADNRIELTQTGLYEVTVVARISPVSSWPSFTPVQYGSEIASALSLERSQYSVPSVTEAFGFNSPSFVAYTDTYVVNVDDTAADFIIPRVWSRSYGGSSAAEMSALVLVRRVGGPA